MSNEEILGFAKLFNDELTLDNVSRLLLQLHFYNFDFLPFTVTVWQNGCAYVNLSGKNNMLLVKCRPRLVNMCKYMGIIPYGTDAYLRYMLRNRLRK